MKKFIFFLAWVSDFILAVIGITWVIYPQYLETFNLSPFMIKAIVLNISLIYIIIFILKLLSKFKRVNDYELKGPDGKISISADAISSIVKEALSSYHDIYIKKIEPLNVRGKFKIRLSIETSTDSNLAEKTASLQALLKKYFKSSVGVEIESIEIKITRVMEKNS